MSFNEMQINCRVFCNLAKNGAKDKKRWRWLCIELWLMHSNTLIPQIKIQIPLSCPHISTIAVVEKSC